MKKLFNLLIVLSVSLLLLSSCDKMPNSKSVALIFPNGETLARWSSDLENIMQAMSEYNIETVAYVSPETAEGALNQVTQIRDAFSKGIETIVIVPIDFNVINESGVLDEKPKANIVCHDRLILNNKNVDYYSSCDRSQVGIMQAQYLIQAYKASGKETMTLEMIAGPLSDDNAKYYFEGAYNLLEPYIKSGKIIVRSGNTTYDKLALNAWSRTEAKNYFNQILDTYYQDGCPDLILSPTDLTSFGIIAAIDSKYPYLRNYPSITGQDNSDESHPYLREGKMGMTIDKSLKAMAYNTALVTSALTQGITSVSYDYIDNGAVKVPIIKSPLRMITADDLE